MADRYNRHFEKLQKLSSQFSKRSQEFNKALKEFKTKFKEQLDQDETHLCELESAIKDLIEKSKFESHKL